MARHRFRVSRRQLLRTGAAALAGIAAPTGAATAAKLLLTPEQSLGPFYPDRLPLDTDNDLVTIKGGGNAAGQITHVAGRVLDANGRPIAGARVEIWQCDVNGRYIHTGDSEPGPRDRNFQGYGATVTGADGGYHFRTIRPVPYSTRTPHIHFAVKGPGDGRLITQMYVKGEARNADDYPLSRITDPRAREAVIVALDPAPELEPDALAGRFDIVLGAGYWPFG